MSRRKFYALMFEGRIVGVRSFKSDCWGYALNLLGCHPGMRINPARIQQIKAEGFSIVPCKVELEQEPA